MVQPWWDCGRGAGTSSPCCHEYVLWGCFLVYTWAHCAGLSICSAAAISLLGSATSATVPPPSSSGWGIGCYILFRTDSWGPTYSFGSNCIYFFLQKGGNWSWIVRVVSLRFVYYYCNLVGVGRPYPWWKKVKSSTRTKVKEGNS